MLIVVFICCSLTSFPLHFPFMAEGAMLYAEEFSKRLVD
jgi:hypothetical protein